MDGVRRAIRDETILYLSGPMTGYENLNFEQFHERAEQLRDDGYVVMNPAETAGGFKDLGDEWYLEHDLHMVTMSDKVAVMEGWEDSEGANLEVHVAKKLGMPVVKAKDPETKIECEINLEYEEVPSE